VSLCARLPRTSKVVYSATIVLCSVRYQRIRPMPSAGMSFVPSASVIGILALKVSVPGSFAFTCSALSGYRTAVENDEVAET